MTTVVYPAFAVGDRASGYVASFPDLPGCAAEATSLAELLGRARGALQRRLEQLTSDGQEWPQASEIEDLGPPPEGRPAGTLLVDVDVEDAPVRVNISIGERLLKRIDQAAESRGMTRSGFISLASRNLLGEGARPDWDSAKLQETLSEYGRTLQEKFGPGSEFAKGFHDLDRRLTQSAESFAQQIAAAIRGKIPPADAPSTPNTDGPSEGGADTRP